MNNQRKIILIGGVILVMILMVWLFSSGGKDSGNKRQVYVSDNWSSNFEPFDKSPKGLYLFNVLVDAHLDTNSSIYVANDWIEFDTLLVDKKPKTFLFTGNHFGLELSEMDTVLKRVRNGSDLFLSYNKLTENIVSKLWKKADELFEYNDSIEVYTKNGQYTMINLEQNDTIATDWGAFGNIKPRGDYKTLSTFMEMDNFIVVKYGKGFIYLHATPNQFYNYQLKRYDGYRYAKFAINQISPDMDVVMLELGRQPDDYGDYDFEDEGDQEGKENDSYWRIILDNPSTRFALILAIIAILLFIIFRSKRTRPIVPYVQKKKDMTLAFSETITSIYFSKRNPYGLLQIQRRNFYDTILKHYYIDLYHRNEDREIEALAEKSDRSVSEIQQIIDLLETKEAFGVNDQTLAKVAKIKRDFYLSMGILSERAKKSIDQKKIEIRRSLLIPSIMVLLGIIAILAGFFYLLSAIGVGIVLWPTGILLTYLGVMRISKPVLTYENRLLTYYNAFGFKSTYAKEDIIGAEVKENGSVIKFTKSRAIIIRNWDLSPFDKSQLNNLMNKLHNEEL